MNHTFHPTILREYDIRGIVGETLHEADAAALGHTFGSIVRRQGGHRVCVAYDGRISSPMLEAALIAGLNAAGVDVCRVGLGPTPMLYFAVHHFNADGGIMVTGSHNPSEYNGFKLMLGKESFFGERITALGEQAKAGDIEHGTGEVHEDPVSDIYIARLIKDFDGGSFRIGWDPGNGATGNITTALTQKISGEHHLINASVDGTFPAHHPDPTQVENLIQLQDLVQRKGLDLGIAFDGDGDRIGAIDGDGEIIWGDQLLAILAHDVLAEEPGATIIADVKASQVLFDHIATLGGTPLMWRTGHSLIKSKMAETGAPLAGEMSGHIFFKHKYYGFDDALYAGLRLLNAIQKRGTSLAEIRQALPSVINTPELRFPCDEARKFPVIAEVRERLVANGANINDIDGVRVTNPDGWWLLRASNTQDVLVARCEANDEAGLAAQKHQLADALKASGITPPEM